MGWNQEGRRRWRYGTSQDVNQDGKQRWRSRRLAITSRQVLLHIFVWTYGPSREWNNEVDWKDNIRAKYIRLGDIRLGDFLRIKVSLLCVNDHHGEKWITFSLADLVDKHFNESVDSSNYVADHVNFRRRDNHYKNLRGNSWTGNSSRKRKYTFVVRSCLYLKLTRRLWICHKLILVTTFFLLGSARRRRMASILWWT